MTCVITPGGLIRRATSIYDRTDDISATVTRAEYNTVCEAIENLIDNLRKEVSFAIAKTVTDAEWRQFWADAAQRHTLELRHAEHAYRKIATAGRLDRYLPATARTPRAHNPGLTRPAPSTGRPAAGDPNSALGSPATSSEPTAIREAATVGRARGSSPAVASEPTAGREPASPVLHPGEGVPADTARERRQGTPPAPSPHTRLYPCCDGFGEHFDFCRLAANVADRNGPRYISPLGNRREHSVLCTRCLTTQTLALDAICDPCTLTVRTRLLTHLDPPAREAMLR